MSDITLNKLSETLNQYTASTLSSISIPEFKGLPNEDVFDFLQRFKLATLTFSDELRCLALNRALNGSARIWAKANIKESINSGDWKATKKAIVERFAAPNQELRHQEKLIKMRFDPSAGTLISYIEEYADCFRKARLLSSDKDIISSLNFNLPAHIIRHLNVLSDDWTNFDTLSDLYKLIKRLEGKILPYEQKPDAEEEKVNMATLSKLLKEMQESFQEQCAKKIDQETKAIKEEAVAAIGRYNNYDRRQQDSRSQEPSQQHDQGFYQSRGNYRGRNFDPNYRNRNGPRNYANAPYPMITQTGNSTIAPSYSKSKENLKAAYLAKHGKPPAPCTYCGEEHFHRHCPYRDLN